MKTTTFINYHAKRIASDMQALCERRGYGIGEIGYNINEELKDMEEFSGIPKSVAREIGYKVEEMLELAQENDMTIRKPEYNSTLENANYEELEVV